MSLEGDIALLKQIPLFADLPTEQLRLLAFSSSRIDLARGEVLFREAEPAHTGYVVSTGGLTLSREAPASKAGAATQCGPGTLLGELALFVDMVRPATATATVDSELLEIDRKLISRMLREYPHLALRLRATLAGRLTATVDELKQVQRELARNTDPAG